MNAEKQQNGLTNNGGRRRRRSSSSGDSDLVVLSVVFNKKKQKQNDEVAIAIERLRENGVNCVLFTMNDFRNANRKRKWIFLIDYNAAVNEEWTGIFNDDISFLFIQRNQL